ncbi:hypothetical protein FoTM2_010867 [Fusarium oxysporum f. sp. vasinfectum]|nr:hypothetical protein FoTM2_010867 [Fusarium oxysporum f. sp. vasinfectum]
MNGTISRNQSNSLLQESPNPASSSTPLGYSTIISQQLDPIDRAFLAGKGVFDLPPQHCLEAILRAHFDFVDPFAPIMDRPSFIRSYKSGCYSLFLMHATLASGAMHVSSDIILECGFGSRLGAQISFSSKATLLYDFGCETDTLHLLQGCVLLGGVAIPSVVEKDCAQRTGVVSQLRCNLSPLTPDDWSPEIITEDCASLLQPLKNQHISAFISYCQLAVTVNQCLTDHQDRSPESIIQPIEAWRVSVQENLQMNNQSQFDRMSSFLLASSYRFECILLRLFRPKWQSLDTERSEQARRQLRYAMFELDTIAGRMLTCNTLLEAPLAFCTCIPILVALHVEIALDPSESEVNQSISRISISRLMLILNQMKEIPSIAQVLPVFEHVLAKRNLVSPKTDVTSSVAMEICLKPADEESNVAGHGSFPVTGWLDLLEFDDPMLGDLSIFETLLA